MSSCAPARLPRLFAGCAERLATRVHWWSSFQRLVVEQSKRQAGRETSPASNPKSRSLKHGSRFIPETGPGRLYRPSGNVEASPLAVYCGWLRSRRKRNFSIRVIKFPAHGHVPLRLPVAQAAVPNRSLVQFRLPPVGRMPRKYPALASSAQTPARPFPPGCAGILQ